MNHGSVVGIFIAPDAGQPMTSVDVVRAVPGRGLEGDRYFKQKGTFWKAEPAFEVTLIEEEAIIALKRDYGIDLAPGSARRNLVTRGAALNHLVGRDFKVGDVLLRGIRLCEPCSYLEKVNGTKLIKGLRHRGGLRAQIVSAGEFRNGDELQAV